MGYSFNNKIYLWSDKNGAGGTGISKPVRNSTSEAMRREVPPRHAREDKNLIGGIKTLGVLLFAINTGMSAFYTDDFEQ